MRRAYPATSAHKIAASRRLTCASATNVSSTKRIQDLAKPIASTLPGNWLAQATQTGVVDQAFRPRHGCAPHDRNDGGLQWGSLVHGCCLQFFTTFYLVRRGWHRRNLSRIPMISRTCPLGRLWLCPTQVLDTGHRDRRAVGPDRWRATGLLR